MYRLSHQIGRQAASVGSEFRTSFQARVGRLIGLTPINETLPEDVFIVGYPKSGNTWVQNLIAGIVYGANPEYAPDTLIQDLVPDVHFKRYYRRYIDRAFFKSHSLPDRRYRNVVYVLRDGRDVMVSYFHHLAAMNGTKPNYLEMIKSGAGLFPSKWHEHVSAWLANPYGAALITVKYEDLKVDPVTQLRRLCDFIHVDRSEAYVSSVVDQASFQKMRAKELTSGWEGEDWPRNRAFVRRGIVGSHEDEMPRLALSHFVAEAGSTLARCEYPLGAESGRESDVV